MCPAGTRCSRSAYFSLSTQLLAEPTGILLGAVCVACAAGQYCPAGTHVPMDDVPGALEALTCPDGMHCPTPAQRLPCPAGSYCVKGTITPVSCDYSKLLNTCVRTN